MDLITATWWAFAVWAVISALMCISRRNPIASVLWLVSCMFALAGVYVLLQAEFIAAVQVLVYAGAVMVLFLFVIMLLGVDKAESLRVDPVKVQRPLAVIVGLGLFGLIGAAIVQGRDTLVVRGTGIDTAATEGHDSNIQQLANNLFSDYVFAFELTSVLLVIAVVGTVLLARRARRGGAGSGDADQAPKATVK